MATIHLLIVGIIFLLIAALVAVLQKGTTGKKWSSVIGSLIIFFVLVPLAAGINWHALFHH